MKSWTIVAGILCCLVLATGCGGTMCLHPYDNCGPVWSQGPCLNCQDDYRAGSILNRPGTVAAGEGFSRDVEQAPEPDATPPITQPSRVTAIPGKEMDQVRQAF